MDNYYGLTINEMANLQGIIEKIVSNTGKAGVDIKLLGNEFYLTPYATGQLIYESETYKS